MRNRKIPAYLLAFVVAVLIFIVMNSGGILANDFLWHVKVGEWIVENKTVPTYGIFSWSAMERDLYWTTHEWLGEVILYVIYSLTSDKGIYLLCFISAVLLMFLIFRLNKDEMKRNVLMSGMFIITLPVIINMFNIPRPHIFSSFFFFATLAILYRYVENQTKWIWVIPVISFLWGNIHGGMATLCYISLFIFLIATATNFSYGRVECIKMEKKQWLILLAVTFLSIVAICLNPNGIKTITFVFSHMADEKVMDVVTEWASPDIKELNSLICAIPIGCCALSFVSSKNKVKAYDALMFLAMTFLFMRSARFAYYFCVSMAFYYFKYMPDFMEESKITRSLKNVYPMLTLLIGATAILLFGLNFSHVAVLRDRTLTEDSLMAIESVNAERPYNFYDLGGELIYHGYDVFIDGRADMYQGEIFDDFYTLMKSLNSRDAVEHIIEKYKFDAFFCLPNEPFNIYLEMNDRYIEYYRDDAVRIWVPVEPATERSWQEK